MSPVSCCGAGFVGRQPAVFRVKSHDRRRNLRHVVLCLRLLRGFERALNRREKQAHENDNDGNDHHQLELSVKPRGDFRARMPSEKVKPDILWVQAFSCAKTDICAKSRRGPRKKTIR